MKKIAVFLCLAVVAANMCFAGRSVAFGVEAFNNAVQMDAKGDVVFSPIGFEIDSAIMADAFDPITKAHFAETLGVLTGIEAAYSSLYRDFAAAATNGVSFKSARAFLVPDYRKVSAAYRQDLERNYRAEVCFLFPKTGAEAWIRSELDGEMEDFAIPHEATRNERNSFFEALSCHIGWAEPFPTENIRNSMMFDAREMDICETGDWTMGRIPMADGAAFYALMPKKGVDFAKVREAVNEKTIRELVLKHKSLVDALVYHGPVVVGVPKMEIVSNTDIAPALNHFKFPVKGYIRLNGDLPGREYRQVCRLRLDERGASGETIAAKSEDKQTRVDSSTRKFILSGRFLFFIYHERTDSILVMGICDAKRK